jgi:hypothetical protein
MSKLTSIEGLTLLAAVLTLGATLYFGLFPRLAVTPKLDDNIAYRNVSTTLIHPGSAFRLASSGLTLVG